MKFGKSLSNQIEETLPEWRDKFLSYKHLKKRLNRIQPSGDNANKRLKTSPETGPATANAAAHGKTTMTEEESDFVSLLQLELDKFNYFFLEKEEEYVIRQKVNNPDAVEGLPNSRLVDKLKNRFCLVSRNYMTGWPRRLPPPMHKKSNL